MSYPVVNNGSFIILQCLLPDHKAAVLLVTFFTLYSYTLVRSSVRGRKEVSWHHDWRIIRKRENAGTILDISLSTLHPCL